MPERSRSRPRERERERRSRSGRRERSGERRGRASTKWDDDNGGQSGLEERPRQYAQAALPAQAEPGKVGYKVIKIMASQRAQLIGRKGCNINEIRFASLSDITIERNDAAKEATIYVRGGNVELAEKMIHEQLGKERPPGEEDWEQKIIDVPQELVGLIIGPGGKKLHEMNDRSGCKMKMIQAAEVDPSAPPGKQVASIKGPFDKIHQGEQVLHEQVDAAYRYHLQKTGVALPGMSAHSIAAVSGPSSGLSEGAPSSFGASCAPAATAPFGAASGALGAAFGTSLGGYAPSGGSASQFGVGALGIIGGGSLRSGLLGGGIIGGGSLEALSGGQFKGLSSRRLGAMARLFSDPAISGEIPVWGRSPGPGHTT